MKNVSAVELAQQCVGFLEGLKKIYQVTKKNLEIRLSDLGLLIDVRGKSTKFITELFMEE